MKIDLDGQRYELDTARIRFRQALVIQDRTGLGIDAWLDSLGFETETVGEGEAAEEVVKNPPPAWLVSVGALYWLMLAQSGIAVPVDDVDFDVQAFYAAFLQARVAELERQHAEEQPAPDPTPPPSQTAAPPSTAPSIPTATTPQRYPPVPGEAPTAY